jgi:very-short-patch-repair endonuclease
MGNQGANTDEVIAKIAARQHGVVSAAQLALAGVSKVAASKRAKAGRLHRIHRGVYAVGHARLSFEGRCMAAALALGGGAVVSHQSAAALWGMLKPRGGPIHITLPGDGGRRRRRGITIHRSPSLIAGVSIRRNGIAVTKPARTLRDLHRTLPQPVYQHAVRKALDLRLISSAELKREEELTRSELEKLMLRLCRRHHLPRPEVNARLGSYEVDFLWRDQRVIVETDSWRHHGDRAAFEGDRARDARLQALGYRVLRFTWRQIQEVPDEVARTLRTLRAVLGAMSSPGHTDASGPAHRHSQAANSKRGPNPNL